MTAYWFKPKRYGFGATPVTWQGWVLVLVQMAIVVGFMVGLALGGITAGRVAVASIVVLLVSAFVVWVSMIKTDGSWAWRWGARGKN